MKKVTMNLKAIKALKVEKVESSLTEQQRAWLDELAIIVGSSAPDDGVASPKEKRKAEPGEEKETAEPGGEKETAAPGFVPELLAWGPAVLDVIKKLGGGRRICAIKVVNNTDRILRRGNTKHEAGNFAKLPPDNIKPGETAEFVASSPEPIPVIDVPPEGCIAEMGWFLDLDTIWFIEWRNPVAGSTKGKTRIEGVNAAKFSPDMLFGNGNTAEYRFTVFGGTPPTPQPQPTPTPGPQPTPTPGPGPTPTSQDVPSSCLITVNNNSKLVLNLADQGHDRGDFMTQPPASIQPNSSAQFVSVETPHAKDEGCKGFVSFEVGSPAAAIWRVEWDNPEGEKNTAKSSAEPQSAGFRTVAQIGQGEENVPVNFTISGGAGPTPITPGPGPVTPGPCPIDPGPEPEPQPEPQVEPPTGSRQPTLRKTDKDMDGWVEYAQELLNGLGYNLKIDGNFGSGTYKAVIDFQTKNGLKIDGIIGNQTWAALRKGTPEPPSTDGRQPHTYHESGAEARWDLERDNAVYLDDKDELWLFAVSVGDQPITGYNAFVRVTAPGGKPKTVKIKIPEPDATPHGQEGAMHLVVVPKFSKQFPTLDKKGKPIPNPDFKTYLVEAWFDKELGPDLYKDNIIA